MRLISIYSLPRNEILEFLLVMLRDRDKAVNISHRAMPTWEHHAAFVGSMPYAGWYIIMSVVGVWAGQIYLTKQHEIGIHLKPEYQGQGIGQRAVRDLMARHGKHRYLANIAPDNVGSQDFFRGLGFKLIQYTFELEAQP